MASNTRDEIIRYIFDAVGGEKIDQVKDSIQKTGEESQKSGTFIGEFEKKLAEIVSIAAAVELALKAIDWGKDQIKGAEDVEASLSRVKALAGDAAGAFGEMDEAVEKAAQTVNVTSQESASGLAALVGQGLNAKAAIEALVPTLQLAKIANIDVGTAAAEVAKQLSAFNLPASDAQKVVDELTAASHGAAGGLAAMSGAATTLAPDAKALDLQFTDIVSILGLLNTKGLDTEKSVRGLRTVFQELQNPASSLRGELSVLGDDTSDFGKAIEALNSGTPRAAQALLTLNGPARSLVETLGNAGPDAIAKFNAKLEESNGIAATTARLLDDNLRGAATRFENSIASIGEKLAKPILTPFKDELLKLAERLEAFSNSPDFQKFVDRAKKMAEDAAKAIDRFITETDWQKFGDDALKAIDGVGKALDAMAKSASTVATVVGKTADAVGIAFHGLGVVVDGVVAGAAKGADGLVTLAEKAGNLTGTSKALTDQTEGLHAALQSVGEVAATNAGAHISDLVEDVNDLSNASKEATEQSQAVGEASAAAAPKIEAHATAATKVAEASKQAASAAASSVLYTNEQREALDKARESASTAYEKLLLLASSGGKNADAFRAALVEYAQAENNLRKLTGTLDAAKASTGQFTEEMKKVGVTSQQSLTEAADNAEKLLIKEKAASDGSAQAIADIQNTFLAYAQRRLAATAQLDEGTKTSTRYLLEQQASVLGVTSALSDLEKQSDSSHAALVSDANRGADALAREADQADRLSGKLHGGPGSVSDSAGQAGGAVDDFAARGSSSLEQLGNYMANTRAGFLQISDAAAKAFDKRVLQDFNGEFDATGIGFAKVISAIGDAAQQTTDEISAARAQLQGMIDATGKIGTESVDDFNKLAGVAKYSESQLDGLISAIQSGNYETGLLGKQELQPLLAALEAAKQRVDALKAASQQASQALADLNGQLQDELDQQAGNQTDIENRSYEKQKQNIEDLAAKADASGKAQAAQALQRLEQLHQAKLKEIADTDAAQQKGNHQPATADTSAASSSSGAGPTNEGSAPGSKVSATTSTTRSGASSLGTLNLNHAITLSIPAGAGLKGLSDDDIRAVAEHVVKTMGPELTSTVIDQLARGRANSILGATRF